jgi:cytochrome c oxidase subunit 3
MAASAATVEGPIAHHFNNMGQQLATVRFGMWIFLVTEVLFFGGALCAYTAYRIWYPKDFEAGSAALNAGIASVNTFLLLTSSLTITLAIRAAYVQNRSALMRYLLLTIVLGSAFLGFKSREYYLDYEEGLIPGPATVMHKQTVLENGKEVEKDVPVSKFNLALEEALKREKFKGEAGKDYDPQRVQLFFMFYYSLTGLHVLHMIVGIGLLAWQLIYAKLGFFDHQSRYVYIEVMSLYWHFVDMVWMFLLPLLYLAGPHSAGQAVEQFKLALGLAGGGH